MRVAIVLQLLNLPEHNKGHYHIKNELLVNNKTKESLKIDHYQMEFPVCKGPRHTSFYCK